MVEIEEEIVDTDVLVAGGGIAGLMAAIKASEFGVEVTVADKENTKRSGDAGMGNDHFQCYVPEVHGPSMNAFLREQLLRVGPFVDEDLWRGWWENNFALAKVWESLGIPMKPTGKYEFTGHGWPGIPNRYIKYEGLNQKPILTREALKRGVKIMNRVMVTDLLTSKGRVIGAIGQSTREPKAYIFHAKSVVLSTSGVTERLYPSIVGGWIFNTSHSPDLTGDGPIMAYRAGADMTGAEFSRRHPSGPRYYTRAGKATWIGVFRDAYGQTIAPPHLTKPDRRIGDEATSSAAAQDIAWQRGRGPLYMDSRGLSEEDYKYMMWGLVHEGNSGLLEYMENEGIDPRKCRIEFGPCEYSFGGVGQPRTTIDCATTVPGLYYGKYPGDISGAAVGGWIAGENAAKYAEKAESSDVEDVRNQIDDKKSLYQEILSREYPGSKWKDANLVLQQIMMDYAGPVRTENTLLAGLKHVQRMRERALRVLYAENPHELFRCLEVLNLMDIAELKFLAMNERKESRPGHYRYDFPNANRLLNKLLVAKQVEGKPTFRWENPRRIAR